MLPKANPKETIPDPKNFEYANVEYTEAVIKYKGWIFQIRPVDGTSMEGEFEIEVKNKLFSRDFYLVRPAYSFEYQKFPHTNMVNDIERFTSLEDAKDFVKDFINNELQ